MTLETLTIARRYCGPSRSGNGGYTCGRLVRHIDGGARVRLKAPPPLETPLSVRRRDDGVELVDGERVIAVAVPATLDIEPPAVPTRAEAEQGTRAYVGFEDHNFPDCFVCGPNRAAGDGLRIFPGRVPGSDRVAGPWLPDASLAGEDGGIDNAFLWAALDCPTAFALMPIPAGRAIVLGELTARLERRVAVGESCIAMAWPLSIDGRKRSAGSVLFTENGERIAVAHALWIEVDKAQFGAA